MTEELRNTARHYELVGAIACAVLLACAQCFLNRDWLVMPMRPGVLLKYLVLNLISYLLALFIVRKWWLVAEVPITGFIATAVLGAVLSAVIVDVPYMMSYLGGSQLSAAHVAESFRRFIYFVVLNCYLTVPIMTVLYWISSVLGAPSGRYGSSDPGRGGV